MVSSGTKDYFTNLEPPFQLFLEKLSFSMKIDWVEASMTKETHVQRFFEIWESFIALLPRRVQTSIYERFQLAAWFQERIVTGDSPIDIF